MTIVETDSAAPAQAEEARLKPKVGRIPTHLRLHEEGEEEQDGAVWAGSTRKGDTQFMFFLVALFVVVNVTLVFLLNYKSKSTPPAATETAAPATPVKPVVAEAPAPAPVLEKAAELPPAPPPATQFTSPTPPTPVNTAAPTSAPTVPLEKSYITPANADTSKATAAPYHPVSVSDHHPAQPQTQAATASGTPQLKVIQSQNLNPNTLPGIAPAAGTTAAASKDLPQPIKTSAPENATQDLLSVISKD